MAGWDALTPQDDLRLRVLGKGGLLPEVEAWAAGRPDVELVVDPPRSEIHASLRASHVLVLLSQRSGWWREQLGLPIAEGLAHGCEIVTTDETGLAGWLAGHGHRVLPMAADSRQIAAALRSAAEAGRPPAAVCADLPGTDGRAEADRWIFDAAEGEPNGPAPAGGLPA
jgi:glycosyltransferase involved in cell wall biosynthesis